MCFAQAAHPIGTHTTPLDMLLYNIVSPRQCTDRDHGLAVRRHPHRASSQGHGHFAFFCSGKRYLVAGQPSESVTMLKQRAFDGGLCATSNPETEVHKWEDIVFIYAGQVCVFCCFDDGRSGNVGLGRFG